VDGWESPMPNQAVYIRSEALELGDAVLSRERR